MKATGLDLANEAQYQLRHQKRNPGQSLVKIFDPQRADYAVVDDERGALLGLLEYKRRSCSAARFETFVLNVQKVIALKAIVRETGLPCTVVMEYEDGDWLYTITPETVDRTAPVGLIGGEIVSMMPKDWFIYWGRSATPLKQQSAAL